LGVWGYQDDIDDEHQSFDEERLCALAKLDPAKPEFRVKLGLLVGSWVSCGETCCTAEVFERCVVRTGGLAKRG
jgi:hypothetical protein